MIRVTRHDLGRTRSASLFTCGIALPKAARDTGSG
jgi:hypothetical protein